MTDLEKIKTNPIFTDAEKKTAEEMNSLLNQGTPTSEIPEEDMKKMLIFIRKFLSVEEDP